MAPILPGLGHRTSLFSKDPRLVAWEKKGCRLAIVSHAISKSIAQPAGGAAGAEPFRLAMIGCLQLCGTAAQAHTVFADSFFAFKTQLAAFAETVELMKLVIAGIRSREEGGREIHVEDIHV
jgi:hypothetical protein